MGNYVSKMLQDFFVAFGIVLGASLLAGVYAVLTLQPPTLTMQRIAENIKIWALVAAVGGTFEPLRSLESHFLEGHLSPAIKEILYLLSAFFGAAMGARLIQWICGGGTEQ